MKIPILWREYCKVREIQVYLKKRGGIRLPACGDAATLHGAGEWLACSSTVTGKGFQWWFVHNAGVGCE